MEKNKGTKIVLTVAIIIILLAIIIILVGTFRKYSIIESYKERDNEIKSADNIFVKTEGDWNREQRKMGNNYSIKVFRDDGSYYTIYDNGQEKWIVYDDTEEKSAVKMEEIDSSLFSTGTNVFFEDDANFFTKLQNALSSRISMEEVDGKECYAIKANGENKGVIYVSKDDYTPVKIERYSSDGETLESSYTYEVQFDVVTEEDVAIPDLSGYTILDRAKE